MDVFTQLKEFRQTAYQCLYRAKDATFEMTDAILLTRNAYSLADLSMCPVFRSALNQPTNNIYPLKLLTFASLRLCAIQIHHLF